MLFVLFMAEMPEVPRFPGTLGQADLFHHCIEGPRWFQRHRLEAMLTDQVGVVAIEGRPARQALVKGCRAA